MNTLHVLRAALAAVTCGLLVVACASSTPEAGDGAEPVASVTQALTTACTFDTIGLPCDPDGPLQPLTECQGVCWIATTGLVACTRINQLGIANLNGRVCGTLDAVGDAACQRYCQGLSCLGANAPAGAACRPSASQDACQGRCDGAGNCESLAQPCSYGRQDSLCKFDTCNLANATVCSSANLRSGTLCSQLDACRVGTCNSAGVCNLNNDVGCNDSNPCTDDVCDTQTGGCISTPDDTNSCSDGNACTTGDFCSAGECQAGGGSPDCDDGNPCTTDSCDVLVGCIHVPVLCSDGNACTTDSCDPATGACTTTPVDCDDGNACTIDACSPATGCSNVPLPCTDGDPCTADSCQLGSCVFVPIAGCGAGGAGAGGEGGISGDGGEGGSAGAGGIGSGGEAGEGGLGGAGVAGEGPAGGGGEAGQPGAAGDGPTGAGGEGGQAGDGGAAGRAGSAGSATTGGTPVGGATASGGVGNRNVVEGGGCSCRVPRGSTKDAPLSLLGGLALLAWRRTRRGNSEARSWPPAT